jgi:hypothetical protein
MIHLLGLKRKTSWPDLSNTLLGVAVKMMSIRITGLHTEIRTKALRDMTQNCLPFKGTVFLVGFEGTIYPFILSHVGGGGLRVTIITVLDRMNGFTGASLQLNLITTTYHSS